MVICLERCVDLHMAQPMPLPITVSCSNKIQIGFTFLVPAHLGNPGQRAVKRVCVCVCVLCCYKTQTKLRAKRNTGLEIWVEVVGISWQTINGADGHQSDKLQPFAWLKDVRDNWDRFVRLTTTLVCHTHHKSVLYTMRSVRGVLISLSRPWAVSG